MATTPRRLGPTYRLFNLGIALAMAGLAGCSGRLHYATAPECYAGGSKHTHNENWARRQNSTSYTWMYD
jgi:hypothetical protein